MQRVALFLACALAYAGLLTAPARSDSTATTAKSTPPPQIYHIVTTALCARLRQSIRPAIAMVLQNNLTIAKSPPLFKKYQRAVFENGVATSAGGDSINNQSPATNMTLQQMSYLVFPISRNLIASQTLLDDPKFVQPTGSASDDALLAKIRSQLLETIAFQSASLDIINGFVATQQMGEIQHAGQEFLGAIQGTDATYHTVRVTPNQFQDPSSPGLPPNPYAFDVAQVPGLAVGYNPLSRIMDGLQWLQLETAKREDTAGTTISAANSQCGT
jgi:hypothetical protein